jgi:capsular exopolysaccharide synthesis family protein
MSEYVASIGFPPSAPPLGGGGQVRHIWRVWRRHVRLFLFCFALVALIGAGVLSLLKPSYTATATVAIAPQVSDPLAPIGQQPDEAVDDDVPATEASKMRSRDVAAAVIAQIPPVAAKPLFNVRQALCGLGFAAECATPNLSPQAEQQAKIDAFLSSLSVVPELHSRIIDISVTAPNGERAALLADAVVTNYQRLALAQQTENIDHVSAWLDERTAQLQQRWLDAVDTANAFSVSHGLTMTNAANGAAATPLIDSQVADMAASLGLAQAKLATAQAQSDALHDAASHGVSSSLLTLSNQPIMVAAANSLLQLENSRDQLAAEFGPAYPKIEALDEQIAQARAALDSQTGVALSSINEDLVSARTEVQRLTANLDQLKAQAATQSAEEAQYLSLTDEAESARNVYETFLEHANDVMDRASLLEPPVNFVSHAGVPSRPTFPNIPKLAIGVAVAALVTGLAATFISDYFSIGFAEMDELSTSTQLPLLATLPLIARRRDRAIERHVLDDPFSITSEALRGLVAKLALTAAEGSGRRTILVTSAGAAEGKSTMAIWLAMTVRQGGAAVLVIDGDHRRSSLMPDGAATKPGLTDLLAGRATPAEVIQTDATTRVDFISSGGAMSRPFGSEEIGRLVSAIATLKKSYGLIVIDSPPLLAMTDGLVYGNVADQTIFVCRWQQTSRKALMASLDRLRAYGAKVSGIVVTMVDQKSKLAFNSEYSRREIRLLQQPYGS